MRHSLLCMLLQLGVSIFYPCFPIGCSGNSNFGFCNKFLFLGAGYQPTAQPPTWRIRGCSSSGLYPSTNLAWLDLPGTKSPRQHSSQGHWVTQAPPPQQGVSPRWRYIYNCYWFIATCVVFLGKTGYSETQFLFTPRCTNGYLRIGR